LLKIDLHVHTHYSNDSLITPEELVFYAKKKGLDGVAITDHDRIDGALKIASETDLLIIPGVEVSSRDGHIIGIFVNEIVPKELSAEETVDRIHAVGGLAVACHPTTFFRGKLFRHVTSKFDAVEVINSSAIPFGRSMRNAKQLASKCGIAQVAGSDAHIGPEIGYAYTLIDAERNTEAVAKALSKQLCQPFGKAIPLTLKLKKIVQTGFKI
jgi:predicted metal-dependent phosphoesterase TrpH